jgi:hypothetical protein
MPFSNCCTTPQTANRDRSQKGKHHQNDHDGCNHRHQPSDGTDGPLVGAMFEASGGYATVSSMITAMMMIRPMGIMACLGQTRGHWAAVGAEPQLALLPAT